MKKLCTLALSLGFLATSCTTALANDLQIYYNGVELELEQPAIIRDDRTLLALRDVAEQMELEISWDKYHRLAEVSFYDDTITFQPDVQKVYLNGVEQTIDVGPQIINDYIYLPVRYIFELFDGNVFYKVYENGTAVVAVNSYDSYSNFQSTEGRLTKVIRKTGLTEDSIVFRNHNNETIEMTVEPSKITMYRSKPTLLNSLTSEVYKSFMIDGQIYDILNKDGKYWAVLNSYNSKRYLGAVNIPTGKCYLEIPTPHGLYKFYGGSQTLSLLDLEGDEGFVTTEVVGYMLDIGAEKHYDSTSYAITDENTYGFLIDGHFVMVGSNPRKNEGIVVKTNETISETMQSAQIFAYGDTFGIIGVDKRENGKEELFTTTYTANGMKANSYTNRSNYYLDERFSNMTITDMVQDGSKVYILLQINTQLYLAAWDIIDNSFTSEKLDRAYTGFVLTNDTYQLFDVDEQYYYFYAIQ